MKTEKYNQLAESELTEIKDIKPKDIKETKLYHIIGSYECLRLICRALDEKSLNNFVLANSEIEKYALANPKTRQELIYYKAIRQPLDDELLEWLKLYRPNLEKLVIGEIKINDPWKKLSEFENIKTIGFQLRKKDNFPKQNINIKRLELIDFTLNTKAYLDILQNFRTLTELKLQFVKITTELLSALNDYQLEELHIIDCKERFNTLENTNIFRKLKKLTTINSHSMIRSKLFLAYCETHMLRNTRELKKLTISYCGEDTAYLPIYKSESTKIINIYVNKDILSFKQELIRFVTSIDPKIQIKVKIFKNSKVLNEVKQLVNKINDIRTFIEFTNPWK